MPEKNETGNFTALKSRQGRAIAGLFFVSALMVALISAVVNIQVNHYVESVTESTRNHLMAAAQALTRLVSAEELDRYHTAQDADTREYREIKDRLIQFAEDYNVLYAYYWRKYDEGNLQYIVDNDTDPETQVGPESFYPIEEIALNALAENVGSTDLGSYTPTWGGLITGYAPVYDSGGNFYCVAGVDISDEFIFIQRRNSRNMTILQIIALSVSVVFGVLNMMLYRRQAESAREANAAKTVFLSQMSHEIRTPLNAVIGFSEIEMMNELPDSSRDNITQIHQSGKYLLGIINDILDISKIESGNIELVNADYETASLISGAVNLNRVRIGTKPVAFILEIDADFPRTLRGDELRVGQILNNLLSNAVKYTREGTVTLGVTATPGAAGEHNSGKNGEAGQGNTALLRFTVRDTGIGIRQEDMGKLFTSYTQLDTEANHKIEGTGLGLSIAKKLARMMGGGISVESEYGKGSVFTAEIIQELVSGKDCPWQSLGEETAAQLRNFTYARGHTGSLYPGKENLSPGGESAWVPSVKLADADVLVVDDTPANLLVARGLLKPYGFSVDFASSGKEAIEKIQNKNYDLVLLDHMMPDMDGVDTVAAIRAWENKSGKNGAIPIVALTSNALRGMRDFFLERGFNDYLSKPINTRVLDEVIRRWIHTPNINIAVELNAQRLDKLNHFCAGFKAGASGTDPPDREIDTEYFERFTALIESFGDFSSLSDNDPRANSLAAPLQKQAALLAEAGRQRDAQKITETLPAFCEALDNRVDAGSEIADGILQRLKSAIQEGDTKKAGRIVTELGTERLNSEARNLYITLYDLLIEDKAQEALERIEEWSKY